MPRPSNLIAEGSCGRSHHHGHHSHMRSHHHHRGRSPSSAGRSTPGSDASNEQAKTRMRWILSLGLLLPALAAIIGVVAWAVSAEVVMGARRESAFKLSGPASRFHSNGLRSEDEFGIDRLDLKPGDAKSRLLSSPSSSSSSSLSTPSSSSSISTAHRNGMSKESRIAESKLDDMNQPSHIKSSFSSTSAKDNSDNRNANVYFLAGLESLNSEAKPSFAGYRSTDSNNNKKSAGARVAEVIDRLVQQRKSEGSSPHIVVVAPLSDKSKKSGSATQTTTPKPSTTTSTQSPRNRYNDEPGAFSRDADTLLAAAHLLARHSIASKRSDDEKGIFSIETSSSAEKPGFESANLIAAQPIETVENTGKENVNTNNYSPTNANQQIAKNAHVGSMERSYNGQGYQGGHMMASASQHHPAYMVSRMGHGPMPSHFRSHHGAMGQIHHQQQQQHQQQHQHHQQGHQQMMVAASQQNPTYVSSYGQHFQGFNGDHQGPQHHHPHIQGPPQGNQGSQVLGPQQSGNQGYQMGHQNQPNGQQVGRDYQLAAENFPRPTFINNRESYVAQESAPLLDFHASQVPPEEESGGYQESSPAKGLTFHFGGGPVGGGGQVMTSPLGIFKTLLLPLLPKPRVNLNGKVVFGVVLEKGVGYGKQKKHHPPPPPPPPPPHGFHHFGRRR